MATTDDVKKLRDMTGISVMQCKQALVEADGDIDKALLILQKKGSAIAAKKSDRELGAGTVASYVHSTKDVGATVVLRSETDFVAKNEEFIKLAYDLAMHVSAASPQYVKREDIDAKKLEAIKEMFVKEVQDKPEALREQILSGKVDAYLKNIVLMEQEYIKDPEKKIKDLLDNAAQKFGERVEVGNMARFSAR
ncbi:MAG: elongation factor Ts [Patescibacteria group bacterium]